MTDYMWIITEADVSVVESGMVGQIGPKGAGLTSFVKITEFGEHFRLLNADGETRYLGYIIGEYRGHEPLNEYGQGKECVAIEYQCDGEWAVLKQPRRQQIRIQVNHPVSIRLPDGTFADDIVRNVSLGGLQLRCTRSIAELFYLSSTAMDEKNRPRFTLGITFPFPEGTPEVVVQCRLHYVRALEEDRFILGVRFEELDTSGHQHFEQFILDCMQPR